MLTNRSLSVIVACYRDEGSVEEMLRRLTSVLGGITSNYEIIYVNDASPDNAEAVLVEAARRDPHLTVISHARNFGSQNAFSSGMRIARGDGVVLMDGDLQDPPEMIPAFVEKWLGGYDVVYGVRVKRKESPFRQIAYKIFYRVFHQLAYVDIPLDAGDFALMDRKVVDVLNTLPERDRFLRGLRAWAGFKQTGVPYVRAARYAGESTNSLWDNIRWAKKGIFSFSYKPLEWISYVAYGVVGLTALAMLYYLIRYLILPDAPPGWMTLMMVTLFFGGIQMLSLSIIGEYLARLFEEVKQRPLFVIKDVYHFQNDEENPAG